MRGMFRYWIYLLVQLFLSNPNPARAAASIPPVVFPPSENWDGDDGQWSSFSLRLGTPEQVVRVLPSTSGYNIIAALPGVCNTTSNPSACISSRAGVFDPSKSTTWQEEGYFGLGIQTNLGYGSDNGDFGLDEVGLGIVANPNLTFSSQVIGGIVTDDFYIGYFGLGTQPTNFTNFTDPHPSFFTALKENDQSPSFTWSYTAGAKYQLTGVLGSLIFGGYDSSRFTPNNVTIPMSPDVSRDLVVGVQSITTTDSSGAQTSLLPSGGIFAFVDSTLPYIWLPVDACQAFEKAFGLTWNQTNEMYLVNSTLHSALLARNANVTFTIGVGKSGGETVDIILPYASFDLTATPPLVKNTTSYFPLKRAANDTQYTIGRAFLQEAYLIADYERMNFSISQSIFQSGAESNIVTIEPISSATSDQPPNSNQTPTSKSHSSISGGAIGGIVVAAVIVVIVICLLIWLRAKHKFPFRKTTVSELTAENVAGLGQTAMGPELPGSEAKPPAEAQDTALTEMEGYYAPKGGPHEMHDPTPAALELPTQESDVHEMFDESVYREEHHDTTSS